MYKTIFKAEPFPNIVGYSSIPIGCSLGYLGGSSGL